VTGDVNQHKGVDFLDLKEKLKYLDSSTNVKF